MNILFYMWLVFIGLVIGISIMKFRVSKTYYELKQQISDLEETEAKVIRNPLHSKTKMSYIREANIELLKEIITKLKQI